MELEKIARSCEARVAEEREKTTLAAAKQQEAEKKFESLFERQAALERRTTAAEDRASRMERELDGYRSGVSRAPGVAAEIEAIRAEAREETERLAAELAATQAHAELAAEARANAAIAQATSTGKLVPRSEIEAYKRQVDLEAQILIDRKIEEINDALAQTNPIPRDPSSFAPSRSSHASRNAVWAAPRGSAVLPSTTDPAVLRARSRARELVSSFRTPSVVQPR
jgi:hypothetical protein